ncbi:RluA family pseudouridine synthase [Anaeromyxobacter sp. Red801]|uniref:RluA family pseudouridine synthase n=1 Tax=Anaeromyxobacter sp. Red801 TaxID=3411632 RepID=UPI003BA3907F
MTRPPPRAEPGPAPAEGGATPDRRTLHVPPELAGARLDAALVRLAPELSRARVQRLVEAGRVRVDGRAAKASARLRGGERVELELPPPEPSGLVAQDLPLAVLHEDADLIVLDKAPGMVVHPARGTPHSTVVNALLHRLGLPASAGPDGALPRLGLVHRLDKDTSGCLVVAKTEAALAALQAQWKGRSVEKVYLALCHGALAPAGRLDTPYGRHPRDRLRFTGRVTSSRRAVTEWRVREAFGAAASLAEVTLHTGRTHQIRVHLSEAGHPLLGDAVYGGTRREARLAPDDPARRAAEAVGRQALHALRLGLDHPRTGRRLVVEAPVPADLRAALEILRAAPPGAVAPGPRRRR